MQALHTAATGMAAQELNVQVISNNIANLRTTGYKKQTAAFQDLIYEHVRRVGAQASDQGTILPVGIDLGGGVKTVGTPRSMTQGTLSQTGNDLDLAITRRRLLQDPDAGRHLPVHPRRHLPDGQPGPHRHRTGQPGAADHHDPAELVGPHGQRAGPGLGDAAGLDDSQIIGQLQLTRFINKAGLQPVGNNQFTDTPSSGAPQDGIANAEGFGSITQGSLEQANVDVVSEMSDLIAAQRAYEMNAKVISAADQMMQSTTALFR